MGALGAIILAAVTDWRDLIGTGTSVGQAGTLIRVYKALGRKSEERDSTRWTDRVNGGYMGSGNGRVNWRLLLRKEGSLCYPGVDR